MYIYKSQVGGWWSSYRGQRKLFHEAANVTNVSVADVSLKYSFTAAKSSAYMIYDLPPLLPSVGQLFLTRSRDVNNAGRPP